MSLELVLKDVNQVIDFLLPHLEIANLNNSDFIIDNHWSLLPEGIAGELLQLDGDSIAELPSGKVGDHFTSSKASDTCNVTITPLQLFIQNCHLNTLPNLVSLSTSGVLERQLKVTFPSPQRPAINGFMSQKKQYEVEHLASISNDICRVLNINKVVDIGSGLGYLGVYMSLMFGYDVLAIDSIKDRTDAAEKRTKLLKKQWLSLIQNALNDKNTHELSSEELDKYKRNHRKSSFTPMCLYITSGAQLDEICAVNFGAENQLMFTALHACGDLTPNILKLFLKSYSAAALCLVGCCYNLLNEQFLSGNDDDAGFPMSNHLKQKSFVLGINARSLASQSPDRLSHLKKKPSESLFWRALLQVILVDKLGRPKTKNQWRVGKIASKCNTFHEYVSSSMKKLGLELKVTEEEISFYLEKYKDFHCKCLRFYQLRVSLGLCVESLIHLDRLAFLLEQDSVKSAHLVQLFDPIQSPRCYALIATKR